MTHTLTTETVKLWRNNAEITAGETAEHDPEHIAAKAILALTAELLANREAQPVGYIAEVSGNRIGVLRGLPLPDVGSLIYTAPPAPAVPDEKAITPFFDTLALDTAKMVMCDVNRRSDFLGGDTQLLARIQCRVDDACRAAMLAQPVSRVYKLVPVELTPEMQAAWDGAPNNSDDDTVNMMNAYRAMIAAAPEGNQDEIPKR